MGGYVFSAPNLKDFHHQVNVAWLPQLRTKYPEVEQGEGELLTPCDLTINSLHRDLDPLRIEHPETYGVCRLAMLATLPDSSLARRAMTLLLACLRTSGTLKVVSEVPKKEWYMTDLYTMLGFTPLAANGERIEVEPGPSLGSSPSPVYMFRAY